MKDKYCRSGLLTSVFLLGVTGQVLQAETPMASSLLAAGAQEMATENIGLITTIEYQTTLLAFSETNPEQATEIRQTGDQCAALVPIGNLCELLTGTFAPPDHE